MALANGCIAQWRLNDNAASATVIDSVDGHNGTYKDGSGDIYTSTSDVTGVINGALDFDGDEYVEIADSNDFSFGDGTDDSPFSISVWVYMDSAASFRIISKYTTGNFEWELLFVNSKLYFSFYKKGDAAIYQSRYYNTALSAGQWYHIVATYDGSGGVTAHDGIKIYIDEVRKDDTDDNAGTYVAMDDGTAPVWIGRFTTTYADGKIDNVMIFNRALSVDEVKRLYNSGHGTEILSELDNKTYVERWNTSPMPLRKELEI